MSPVLGYWNIKGLAHPIRLLLEYLEVPFKEELYDAGHAPNYDKHEWLDKKHNIGLDFPNLPYYKDGEVHLTQFHAIMMYIAQSNGMGGDSPKERAKLAMTHGAVDDLRWSAVRIFYNPKIEEVAPDFRENLPKNLQVFEKFLEKHPWISGDKIDYPDFNLFDLLGVLQAYMPDCLEKLPKLKDYVARFGSKPKVAAFVNSPRYKEFPYNNKMAKWGNTV